MPHLFFNYESVRILMFCFYDFNLFFLIFPQLYVLRHKQLNNNKNFIPVYI